MITYGTGWYPAASAKMQRHIAKTGTQPGRLNETDDRKNHRPSVSIERPVTNDVQASSHWKNGKVN